MRTALRPLVARLMELRLQIKSIEKELLAWYRTNVARLMELRLQIKSIEKELLAWYRTNQESRRLETIPGVGFITATMEPLKLLAN